MDLNILYFSDAFFETEKEEVIFSLSFFMVFILDGQIGTCLQVSERKQAFLKKYFKFATVVDVNKYLKQIKLPISI